MINFKKPEIHIFCNDCAHKNVCQYKKEFENIVKAVDNVVVTSEDGVIAVKDIPWVKPIIPECANFIIEIKNPRTYYGYYDRKEKDDS